MKTFNLFFAILFSIFFFVESAKTQELNAMELVDNILEVQSMRELTKFREDLLKELRTLDMSNITPEESAQLAQIYDKMKVEYNTLIGLIKQDVLDFKNIKLMSKNSSEISQRYNATIRTVSNTFNNEFVPLYSSLSQDRSLIALIFPLIEKGVRFIIDIIKQKKLKKETLMNDLLNVTNLKFNDVLVLPEWNRVVKVKAISSSNLISINSLPVIDNTITTSSVTNDVVVVDNNNNNTKSTKLSSSNTGKKLAPIVSENNLNVEYPAMKELKGNIQFVISDESGNLSSMDFLLPETISQSRDLKVGSKSSVNITKTSFGTTTSFEEGTSFQIRITNTAFVYVFAFNSNNTCYQIYPYSQEWIRGFEMSKNRDLGVGPLMLKDENNLLTIPSKNEQTGEENYIQISGNSNKEQFCLVLSKSELNLQDICQKIDTEEGDFTTRVNKIFSAPNVAQLTEANLSYINGKINFEINDEQRWLIPLIFEIKR